MTELNDKELNENLLDEVNGGMNKEELVGASDSKHFDLCPNCGEGRRMDKPCPYCGAK